MSDMTLAVLRMPPDCWGNGAIDQMQRHHRYVEAANTIEALTAERDVLIKEREYFKRQMYEFEEAYELLKAKGVYGNE